jgi:hypothetical protein
LLARAIASTVTIDIGAVTVGKRRGVGIASVVYTVPGLEPARGGARRRGGKGKPSRAGDNNAHDNGDDGETAGGFFITQDPDAEAASRAPPVRYEDMTMEERLHRAFFEGVELDPALAAERCVVVVVVGVGVLIPMQFC